jgi:archaellum biogenesis protein FlaJ (TadC family)
MVSKKYIKDYEVEYETTPNGRLKARAVYKGKYFEFCDTDVKRIKTAAYFTMLTAAAWVAFFIPLTVISAAARTSYVIIPHACVFLTLISMSAVVYDLWTAKPPLTREKSDNLSQRAPRSALLMTVFAAAAAAGFIIRLCLGPAMLLPGDLVFALCELILLAASCLLFVGRGRTATRET